MDRDTSDFMKAMEIRKDSEDLVSDLLHCIAQIENIQYLRY